jgi:hypothetical protein
MLRQVEAAFPLQMDAYAAAFNAATEKPCPTASAKGSDSKLETLRSRNGFGAVICGRCRGRFAFTEEE